MSDGFETKECECRKSGAWSLMGVAALVGLTAAALFVLNQKRRQDHRNWSVEDLFAAADRAAENLEHSLLGEAARAS